MVSFRGFFEDYIFAWWNYIWVFIILLFSTKIICSSVNGNDHFRLPMDGQDQICLTMDGHDWIWSPITQMFVATIMGIFDVPSSNQYDDKFGPEWSSTPPVTMMAYGPENNFFFLNFGCVLVPWLTMVVSYVLTMVVSYVLTI